MAELIDREKLLEELKESAKYHADNSREEQLLYRDRVIVREQPTVEERKQGEWIEHKQMTVVGSRDYLECSCCKVWFARWKMPRNSFCPNCGAKMREVDND